MFCCLSLSEFFFRKKDDSILATSGEATRTLIKISIFGLNKTYVNAVFGRIDKAFKSMYLSSEGKPRTQLVSRGSAPADYFFVNRKFKFHPRGSTSAFPPLIFPDILRDRS